MLLNKKIPGIYIFNKVKYELLYVLAISVITVFVTSRYKEFLPEMPLTIPAFIGTAISILLSFKLNQSYDRWWEARKIWGGIVNDSRSFTIQLKALVNKEHAALIKKLVYRQIAWCYALGQSLRGLDPHQNLNQYLDEADLNELKQHKNVPLAILNMNSSAISELKNNNQLELFSQLQLNETIVRLCDSQGKAERIKSTVFPVTYRLFLHFIIYLFVITLSISLRNVAGYFEIPLLLVLSAAFFLLERSATHMQDPFENRPTDTAMTAIARTIEINLKQLINDTDIPAPLPAEKFYLN